jgi:hypothetical protein
VFLLANLAVVGKGALISGRTVDPQSTHTVFGLTVGIAGFLAAAYPDMHLFTRDMAPVFWVFLGLLFALTMRAPEPLAAPQAAISRPVFAPVGARVVSGWQPRRRLESQK